MTGIITPNVVRQLDTVKEQLSAVELHMRDNWLANKYRQYLYGGWCRDDGSAAPPHRKAIAFHEAEKMLFCPGLPGAPECGAYLGQIGCDPDETWDCPACEARDLRLPPPRTEPAKIIVSAPTYSKHFPLTNGPYLKERLSGHIVNTVKNQQGVEILYEMADGSEIHCLSYEQDIRKGTQATSPFEGSAWTQWWADEPPTHDVYTGTMRGLTTALARYDGYPFVQQHKMLCAFGGNRCLAGETRVWDAGRGAYRRIDEIDGPITVLAWDGSGFVEAYAETHERKGPDPLYRVTLKSGASFAATADHRVLTDEGWRPVRALARGARVRAAGSLPAGSSRAPRRTSRGNGPSARGADAQRSMRTAQGSPGGCRPGRHSCGGRLRHGAGSDQGALPSPAGAPGRSLLGGADSDGASHWGARPPTAGRSPASFGSARPSTQGDPSPGAGLAVLPGCRASGTTSRSSGSALQDRPQRRAASARDPRSARGAIRLNTPSSTSAALPSSGWDTVETVQHERVDFHYDLWVPGYENFVAEGVVQHNSSKSFTGASILASWYLGERPWDGTLVRGFGQTVMTCTPLKCAWIFHDIYKQAYNKGGEHKHIFAMEFSIWDNPAQTEKSIKQFALSLSPEERDVRLTGRFQFLTGRVFSEFDETLHVYDDHLFDPLRLDGIPSNDAPSNVPIIHTVDPHPKKHWMMSWHAVMPDGTFYCVREWPNTPYERLGASNMGLDAYAAVIAEIEAEFPGGKSRVLWRDMDPNMGRTPQIQERGSTTLTKEMRKRGYFFRDDVNDKITHGHSAIHTLLAYDKDAPIDETNRPRYFVERKCRNVLYGFNNYCWEEDKNPEKTAAPKPKDIGKDAMDTVRYAAVRDPHFIDWQHRGEAINKQVRDRLRRVGQL